MAGQVAAVETHDLGKDYGSVVALGNLSLSVPAGAVFGFIGPNGAGKTTTLRLLLALQRPTRGEARLWGQVVRPGAKVLRDVGALVERPGFYPYLSGRRNLLLFAAARGLRGPGASDAVQVALESVDMTGPASRPVGGYSTGMQQRLAIGLASLGDPRCRRARQLPSLDHRNSPAEEPGRVGISLAGG